eukprot:1183792-Prorocentrum_minimum.AAC.2
MWYGYPLLGHRAPRLRSSSCISASQLKAHNDSIKHTLPQYLHREWITDKRAIECTLRGDRELPPEFVPLGKGDDRRVVMLEVSYAAIGLMST